MFHANLCFSLSYFVWTQCCTLALYMYTAESTTVLNIWAVKMEYTLRTNSAVSNEWDPISRQYAKTNAYGAWSLKSCSLLFLCKGHRLRYSRRKAVDEFPLRTVEEVQDTVDVVCRKTFPLGEEEVSRAGLNVRTGTVIPAAEIQWIQRSSANDNRIMHKKELRT